VKGRRTGKNLGGEGLTQGGKRGKKTLHRWTKSIGKKLFLEGQNRDK